MASVWAIADLHLSFGVPKKKMDVFGSHWVGWTEKIQENWEKEISDDDLVLLPGDLSWAMHLKDALPDLEWVDQLPGTKVLIRGNHDYWWSSVSKMRKILPPSIHIIQNDAFHWKNIGIAGARLWDTPEYDFHHYIEYIEIERTKKLTAVEKDLDVAEKIFSRDLGRLELSLECLKDDAEVRITMTHYPPVSADLRDSRVSALLEKYGIKYCVFGHLHNIKPGVVMFGEKNGIQYHLTSCDYLNFKPLKILVLPEK